MQYCPETIIVHSAFSLAEKQLHNRSRSLQDLTKRECISSTWDAVFVVTESIREATSGLEYRQNSVSPLFSSEISNLNYKLNAWIFKTWQRYLEKSSGEGCVQHSKKLNEFFSCFPPLPNFSTAVYLALVKDLGWCQIMIECLHASVGHGLGMLLKDLTDALMRETDEKDVNIFVELFDAFIGYNTDLQTVLSVSDTVDLDLDCGFDEILLQGLVSVKQCLVYISDQETVIKALIKCVIAYMFSMNRSHVSHMFENVDTVTNQTLSTSLGLDKDLSINDLFKNDFLFSHLDTRSNDELGQIIGLLKNSQTECMKELSRDIYSTTNVRGFPKTVISYLKNLCDILESDWEICSRRLAAKDCRHDNSFAEQDTASEVTTSDTDNSSYHPLHKWLVGLLGALLIVISNAKQVRKAEKLAAVDRTETSLPSYRTRMSVVNADNLNGLPMAIDRTLLSVAEALCDSVKSCVLSNLSLKEQEWIGKLEKGETVSLETIFSPKVDASERGVVKKLLSSQGDIEEKLKSICWRIDEKLEGYEDCFDWLLTAEELYSIPVWLECIKNHSINIADKVQLLKMIDIICVLQEVSDNQEVDEPVGSFAAIKQTILEVYSTLNLLEQEEIIEYSFNMSSLHAKSELGQGSVFFQANDRERDFSDFQRQLVSTFNRIVDSSNKKQFFEDVTEISRMALVSPYLTISRAVQEAVVNSGHTKIICKILQQLPTTCKLQFGFQPRETLLCHAVKTASSCVTTQQEEKNYLHLVAILLKPFKPCASWATALLQQSPLLRKQELVERCILPHLHQHGSKKAISKVLAIKVLGFVMTAVNQSQDITFLKKHLLCLLLALCELLDECKVLWDGLSPDISLVDIEEKRELVLDVLEKSLALASGVLQTYPSFTRAVEWLLRRTEGLDWTIPLHLYSLHQCCSISSYTFSIPDSVLTMCELSTSRWSCFVSGYGPGDTVVTLFECCRVSDSLVEEFSAALRLEKWKELPDMDGQVINALAQVLTHSSSAEWRRILNICRVLLQIGTVKDETVVMQLCPSSGDNTSQLQFDNDSTEKWFRVARVSCILVKVLKTLSAPSCSSWATPHMWSHVTKHYVTSVKSLCDELSSESHHIPSMEMSTISVVFVHVCDAMTHTSAVTDQLFVLALDLANKVSSVPDYTAEQYKAIVTRLHEAAFQIPLQVYREALLQTLT